MDSSIEVDAFDEPDPRLNAITNTVLSCAFAVHTDLGPGHLERVYANALQIEFQRRGVRFVREASFAIKYQGAVVESILWLKTWWLSS